MTIRESIWESLDNAVDNGYPHDYNRPALEYVREIDDSSGIEGYHPDHDQTVAIIAVIDWRYHNRNEEEV